MQKTTHIFRAHYFLMLCLMMLTFFPQNAHTASGLEGGLREMAQQIVANSKSKNIRTIGITSFPHINGDYSELSNFISDELVLQLFTIPDFDMQIIERNQLNKIFKELNLSVTGVIEADTIQKLGRLHGVDALVLGSITDIGEQIKLTARLVDTETGRVFSAAGTTIPETSNVKELMEKILIAGGHGSRSRGGKNVIGAGRNSTKKKKQNEAIYTLDLQQYEIGDIPEELGSVVVAPGNKMSGKRVLKGFNDGLLTIDNLDLQGDFIINFSAYGLMPDNTTKLHFADGSVVQWKFGNGGIFLGDKRQPIGHSYTYKPEKVEMKAVGRTIKLFIDNRFIGSQLRNPDLAITSFSCSFRSKTELADLKIIQKEKR